MRNASTQSGYDPRIVDEVISRTLPDSPNARRPWLVGLSALQGSGKTTFASQFVGTASASGLQTISMSLDDFYLGRRERTQLAQRVHPLLATRGVPGTHDIGLLERTLDALALASPETPVRVPRFDKGRDTRVVPSRWRRVTQPPDLVLLEGWCVGLAMQHADALLDPVNALERDEDRDLHWRKHVNDALAGNYADLWQRLDRLIVLHAPDFSVVATWRDQQEQALRKRQAKQAMSAAALTRFIQHYERLSRHALYTLPGRADVVLELDAQRNVLAIKQISPSAASSARTARY